MKDTPVLEAIRKRRSIRKYKQEQIGDDELRAIIEAGRCAPSGGNSQTCHFIVIQNRRVLGDLSRIVQETFAAMTADDTMYKGLIRVIELLQKRRV